MCRQTDGGRSCRRLGTPLSSTQALEIACKAYCTLVKGVKPESEAVPEVIGSKTNRGEAPPFGAASHDRLVFPSVYTHRMLERLGHTPPSSLRIRMLH